MSETNVNAVVAVPEYAQLVGQGAGGSGDLVINSQGGSKEQGFSRVSQYWLPTCLTYEQCLDKLAAERSHREDIVSAWSDWEFVPNNRGVGLKNVDGRVFTPTEYALTQLCDWSSILPSFVHKTIIPEFEPDETDIELLCLTLNHRKIRKHEDNKNEGRELLFRTYDQSNLRAVLTKQYAAIDNEWFINVLKDLIPNGMVSHLRGNCDDVYANILIPDSIRHEEDSDYGAMFAVRNSEIGRASLDCLPSLFRAICRNGCIHQSTTGINLRQVHKGEIKLDGLAMRIGECLDKQIKLIPEVMENFIALRQYEFSDVGMEGVFAAVAERVKFTPKQACDIVMEFMEHESHSKTAFSVINSITRAGQLYNYDVTETFDKIGGNLISTNWDNIKAKAKTYSDQDLIRILGL